VAWSETLRVTSADRGDVALGMRSPPGRLAASSQSVAVTAWPHGHVLFVDEGRGHVLIPILPVDADVIADPNNKGTDVAVLVEEHILDLPDLCIQIGGIVNVVLVEAGDAGLGLRYRSQYLRLCRAAEARRQCLLRIGRSGYGGAVIAAAMASLFLCLFICFHSLTAVARSNSVLPLLVIISWQADLLKLICEGTKVIRPIC
jgi:hypothetical protein